MNDLRKQIYHRYNDMIGRCYRVKNKEYHRYGGRGICVCDEWKNDFNTFYLWSIEKGYLKELSIDRINTNGNYEPSNCRWVSMKIQANNTRRNRILIYENNKYTMEEAAVKFGISSRVLQGRLNMGWTDKEAIETPYSGNVNSRKQRISESDKNWVITALKRGVENSIIAQRFNLTEARIRQIRRKYVLV